MHNAEFRVPVAAARRQELLRFQTLFCYLIRLLLRYKLQSFERC